MMTVNYNYLSFIKKAKRNVYNRLLRNNPELKIFWNILNNIKSRCLNSKNPDYKYYGGRGIGFLITIEELIKLWFRDKAYNMKQPSIDRIDNDGHYTYENCRFIELSENTKKSNIDRKNRKKVVNFLKEI